MGNQNVLSVQEQDVSKIEETNKTKEPFRAIESNAPQAEREKAIVDRREFVEA